MPLKVFCDVGCEEVLILSVCGIDCNNVSISIDPVVGFEDRTVGVGDVFIELDSKVPTVTIFVVDSKKLLNFPVVFIVLIVKVLTVLNVFIIVPTKIFFCYVCNRFSFNTLKIT